MGIARLSVFFFTPSVVTNKPKTDTMCLSVFLLYKHQDYVCSVTHMYIYLYSYKTSIYGTNKWLKKKKIGTNP